MAFLGIKRQTVAENLGASFIINKNHVFIYNKRTLFPFYENIIKYIIEKQFQERVMFLGFRDREGMIKELQKTSLLILPSRYESFGMVALEAMACGTPVVASEVGGLAFLVQDGVTGFHFPAEDSEALSDKLITLIENEEIRKNMSENAVSIAKNYDWQIIAQQIIDLYEEVTSE